MNQNQTTMQQALADAGISIDHSTLPTPFASDRVAGAVAFVISAEFGKAATRLQKLANPPKGATIDSINETKAELTQCIRKLAWGMDNLGEHMRDMSECIAEWCGGGYSRPAKDDEISQVANFLQITEQAAKATAEANRLNRTSFLTIRRQGLAPVMETKLSELLARVDEDAAIEPDTATIEKACNQAFASAMMWGNWAEAALVKADMVYHCGKAPTMPEVDRGMADKAERAREALSRRQAEQAQRDAQALQDFDLGEI